MGTYQKIEGHYSLNLMRLRQMMKLHLLLHSLLLKIKPVTVRDS